MAKLLTIVWGRYSFHVDVIPFNGNIVLREPKSTSKVGRITVVALLVAEMPREAKVMSIQPPCGEEVIVEKTDLPHSGVAWENEVQGLVDYDGALVLSVLHRRQLQVSTNTLSGELPYVQVG